MKNKVLQLIKEMNLAIFNENDLVDKQIIVLFPGKFQPMGQHQREEYLRLGRKFGKQNVYVVTDDKMDPQRTPLSFDEKVKIIKRHGINNIKKVVNPFMPTEIFGEVDASNTVIIFAVSS